MGLQPRRLEAGENGPGSVSIAVGCFLGAVENSEHRALTLAVAKQDALRFYEPPDWLNSVRHPLGAFLLKANRPVEAEAVYWADLSIWPENGCSLYGLYESLDNQGRKEESLEVYDRLRKVWKTADDDITSSCICTTKPARKSSD